MTCHFKSQNTVEEVPKYRGSDKEIGDNEKENTLSFEHFLVWLPYPCKQTTYPISWGVNRQCPRTKSYHAPHPRTYIQAGQTSRLSSDL